MKFADKLFFVTTAVLAVIFAIFGSVMVSTYFQNVLNRETFRADTESKMFQYLFETAYSAAEEYGEEYAVSKAINSVTGNVEKAGIQCFVIDKEDTFLYGEELQSEDFQMKWKEVKGKINSHNTCAYGIAKREDGYYLLHACEGKVGESFLYLGICVNLTDIYADRQLLLNRYRFALFALVILGGGVIYLLSRYMTRPIRRLGSVANRIASGDYKRRSDNHSEDEIGELARNFNSMADKLVEQMREKELEAKQKEDFTAAFAHELKTPLTSIIGYADMLNSVSLSEEEKREAYFYIYSQGKRLESLSHKLLELVSANQGGLVFKPIQTKSLEENIHTTMRPIFAKKKIKGKIFFEKAVINGDAELLLSLFYNLLDNAVKAVEEGGFILLKGTVLENGYEVKVVDNGRGIPKEEIHRITEAFYMVDKSRSRKEGGAGIGMALCQKIITLHGGRLQIDSRLSEGTVIKIIFEGNGEAE